MPCRRGRKHRSEGLCRGWQLTPAIKDDAFQPGVVTRPVLFFRSRARAAGSFRMGGSGQEDSRTLRLACLQIHLRLGGVCHGKGLTDSHFDGAGDDRGEQ